MNQILEFLQRIASQGSLIGNIVQQILNIVLGIPAAEDQQRVITEVDDMWNSSVGVDASNATILALIATNQATLTSQLDDIEVSLAALAGLPAAVASLSTVIGGGGADLGGIADQVWSFPLNDAGGKIAQELMSSAGRLAENVSAGVVSWPVGGLQEGQSAWGPWGSTDGPPTEGIHNVDWTTIEATDATPLDWFKRVYDDEAEAWGNGKPFYSDANPLSPFQYTVDVDYAKFAQLKALLFGSPTVGAPVWPGLAGVTLLTPVAFSDSFTIGETCQGVLIEITSAPSKQGTFDFDGLVSYRNAGAVAFVSDDGQAEISQPLGFTTAVYLCRTMVQASAVKVRVTPGIAGTCTPFTIP